jgi:hypothetical protein
VTRAGCDPTSHERTRDWGRARAILIGVVADLPVAVPAPTPHGAGSEACAGVMARRGDLDCVRERHGTGWSLEPATAPDLTRVVQTPTRDPVARDSADMGSARADLRGTGDARNGSRREVLLGTATMPRLADLTFERGAPAQDFAVHALGAAVIAAERDAGDLAEPGDGYGDEAILAATVTDLTVPIVAPARDRPVFEHGAGVAFPPCDRGRRADAGDARWRRAVVTRAAAELTITAMAPTPDLPEAAQRAGVERASRDRDDVGQTADRRRLCAQLLETHREPRVTELAVLVRAPARDTA